ncbi:MAG: biotin/lipoyl-containing protein, partial [Eubacterium sp.]
MAADIILPKLGMDMQTGTIMKWYKNEGDPVKKGEPLFELMTDKVNLEVEAEDSGVLLKCYYEIGAELPIFTVIGCIGEAGEALPEHEIIKPITSAQESGNLSDEDRAALKAMRSSHKEGFAVSQRTIRATPSARRLASDHQIDLALIEGSGPKGRIQVEDITAYLGGSAKVEKTEVPQQKVFEAVEAPSLEGAEAADAEALKDLEPEENPGMKDALDLTLEELVAGIGPLEDELGTKPKATDVM